MNSYLGTLDLSWFPAPVRRKLAAELVPALLNRLGADGLRVSCSHDLRLVRQVQRQSPERPRLFELANPELHPHANAADTFVLHLTRESTGEDVAVAACRLRWVENSLASALESKKLILDSPSSAGGEFKVTTDRAHRIRDVHVAVTTGLTVLPDNRGAFKATIRLLHLWALANWRFHFYVAICSNDFAAKYPLDIEGYSAVHSGVMWKRPTDETPEGIWTPYRLVLAEREHWRQIVTAQNLSDLSLPLGTPTVDGNT